ncbi:flagellar hook-associated protein FlgL [Paraburkholderia phenazinium]|jgi:flagellar hook-associated protein 3 FlgL|uniref:Flagellar hook-associated protein 3 FlgL n=1 Tax=Paraburkholderia phenazinium TaxID=60549 RepID=A0A1G7Q027_9BURK|nr:flagellar hook-associated protein FlgL [Paraburkholderia phenazinium]SDF91902.1 flagellar hook-associated protein 3 FlgL [Paraburkholderia phenazinium]
MRISTSQYLSMNVQTMDNQQSELTQLYGEISSGVSLSTPADNPLGAAQAVQLSMQGAALSQYSSNQSSALTALQSEDSTLQSVTSTLQSVNSQLLSAGNPTLNDTNRSAIAATLQQLNTSLMTLANTKSPSGNYLFGGFQSASQPFTQNSAGTVVYNGDNGVSTTQIADTSSVATNDSGQSVFMSVTPQTASPVAYAAAGNTGTGVIGPVSTTNAAASATADTYGITFSMAGTPAVLSYTVSDVTNPATPAPTPQPYTAGSAITLGTSGESVSITGTPAAGDAFTVTPAAQVPASQGGTNIFATIQNMITALQTPADTPAAAAALTNSLNVGLTQVQNTLSNVTTVLASVGGRENQIQAMQTVNQNQTLQNTSSLADLTDTNMASTISKYTQTQYSLQASQQAFVQVQQMSLFQYLNQ